MYRRSHGRSFVIDEPQGRNSGGSQWNAATAARTVANARMEHDDFMIAVEVVERIRKGMTCRSRGRFCRLRHKEPFHEACNTFVRGSVGRMQEYPTRRRTR
jgi:hypothetical protein